MAEGAVKIRGELLYVARQYVVYKAVLMEVALDTAATTTTPMDTIPPDNYLRRFLY